MIRVMVVDDSALMRRMLQDLLPRAGGIEVPFAAEAATLAAPITIVAPSEAATDGIPETASAKSRPNCAAL